MGGKRKVAIAMAVLALALIGAIQLRPVRNLYFAMTYERVFDRYDQTDKTPADVTATVDARAREARVLSAFFGLDNGLPSPIADFVICDGAAGSDGMPVIFSHEIDVQTVEPGDFRVVRLSGTIGEIACLTMAPADGPGELRTVLLAGQFGGQDDPPVSVEIAGHVLSQDQSITFKGARVDVTPLEEGPGLVFAQILPEASWNLGQQATSIPFGGGSGCPVGTKQIVMVTWAGGITKPSGDPADAQEGALYQIALADPDTIISPTALADTGDGDNNHKLCLDKVHPVSEVRFPAGHVTDPRDDLNPATSVSITQ